MDKPANIYSVIVFDMHPKIREFIDALNNDGQIDLDDNGYPYLLGIEKTGPNHVCQMVRNGNQENFVMNTRRQADPIMSWNPADGFKRKGGKKVITVDVRGDDGPRPERARRPSFETFQRLTDDILKG